MSRKSSSDGSSVVGGVIFVVIVLIAVVPKPVWIALGVIVALTALTWIFYRISVAVDERRAAEEERRRVERAQQAAAEKREREERVRKARQRRIDTLGKQNAARVESTLSAVQKVKVSEAARAGWLGEVDFSADIKSITENFEKAHALRAVTSKLAALDKPNADDTKILAEAKTTITALEGAAIERVTLIEKCATEAQLIDKSLQAERDDARIAEQRAELHGKLSGMLYGIEAAPTAASSDSAAAAVMARVQAYREIKNQIERAREGG
ncbi:hypothetical protein [Mycolicibacterium parafortuitum]|uniref:Uncharacterized protein n=1 Tax=Mycolicibacterium parafortuitum TaxID=39692 RepID=A0A375YG91_MYCPF|nr:hypothetical protein [Mycolicibacterium parafortuitum]ORB28028.1 hypothetical protein BST38_22015 [Mycolicibacterium parafortuitum]SRX80128.1 hypothetical protein MPP7335_01867 [Mycolicibacterium parafortuitum]